MNKTFKITVDTQKPVQNPSFHVNTNDLRTIHLLMSVQSNGKPVNLEDAQVRIAVLKPDKKTVFQDVVVVDAASGLCEVILDSQAYVVPGEHTAELMIYFVGERVSVTGRFNYRAISGILNDKTVESQNEYQAINKLVLDAETAAQNAKQSENNAKESELVAKQAETNAVNAAANALDELEERTEQFYEQKAAELRAPIDDLSAQLAQKVTLNDVKNNIGFADINKNLSKINETMVSDTFKQQMAGNTPIHSVPAVRSVTTDRLARKAVDAERLSDEIVILEKSINLIDPSKITEGGYYSPSTGEWVSDNDFGVTEAIEVEPNGIYSKSLAGSVTYWGGGGDFIIGESNAGQTFTVPDNENIVYAIVNLYNSSGLPFDKWMLVEGEVLPSEYTPYYRKIKLNEGVSLKVEATINELEEKFKSVEVLPPSINIFNKDRATIGGYYNSSTGSWVSDALFAVSEPLPVKPKEVISRETGSGQVTFWDVSGKYVTGLDTKQEKTFTVPDIPNITHMVVNVYLPIVPLHRVMVVKGNNLPETYIPYYEEKYKFPKDKYVFEQDDTRAESTKIYMAPEIEEYKHITNPILTKSIVTDRTGVTGVADPFIVFDKGCYHMFFEVLGGVNPNTLEAEDEIGHAYSYNLKDWTYTQIVISKEEHGHRSAYPNVFKYNGEWYMLPDVVGDIKLYKATNFPLEWEFQTNLLEGIFVDTNVFEVDGVWYMTTSPRWHNSIKLYYNMSGDWRNNEWIEHPLGNIIEQDELERGKRNAGKIFHGGDHIIMPVQITPVESGQYGEYVYWYKLSDISPTTCIATNLGKALDASRSGDWKNNAMHHITHVEHSNGTIYAVDGLRGSEYSIGLYQDVK